MSPGVVPAAGSASTTVTRKPARARLSAWMRPTGPAPTTSTLSSVTGAAHRQPVTCEESSGVPGQHRVHVRPRDRTEIGGLGDEALDIGRHRREEGVVGPDDDLVRAE